MDFFQIVIMIAVLATIALQVAQIWDFTELRSLVIEAFYFAIIIALMIYYRFFPWLNNFLDGIF